MYSSVLALAFCSISTSAVALSLNNQTVQSSSSVSSGTQIWITNDKMQFQDYKKYEFEQESHGSRIKANECAAQCVQPRCVAYQLVNQNGGSDCHLLSAVPPGRLVSCPDGCAAGYLNGAPSPRPAPPVPPPPSSEWPVFRNAKELQSDPWGAYFTTVYGSLPSTFPLDVQEFWMLYDTTLKQANVNLIPPIAGKCPGKHPRAGLHYGLNNAYSPADTSWIWHPYPWKSYPENTWVEIMREQDPFGDEHFGAWFVTAKGSGIYLNTGTTITFDEHSDAYTHFGVTSGDYNEGMCRKAAEKYDTVQFLKHQDDVNYPCDPQDQLPYMNVEIVGVKMVGTYSCGSSDGKGALRAGWEASKECICDNSQKFTNCFGVPTLSSDPTSNSAQLGRPVYV